MKAAARQPMNSTITPFQSSLPVEILSWIFIHVCANMHPCPWSAPICANQPKYTNYPVILSHVCATWRRVAISTTCLWSHIDLHPSFFRDGQLPPRTKAYLSRAGDRLLDIHAMIIVGRRYHIDAPTIFEQNMFIQFLESISPRACSITVALPSSDHLRQRTVSAVFDNCIPGVLTQVSFEVLGGCFSPGPAHNQTLPEQLETLGYPVTVLRLHTFLPPWTSKIHHGFTELRLKRVGKVSQLGLMNILSSCPKLRILDIVIDIMNISYFPPPTPVHLIDLELLVSTACVGPNGVQLLRMIQPGSRPLTFSMHGSLISLTDYSSGWNDHTFERFFARVNITCLIIYALTDYKGLAKLLALALKVQVLALNYPYDRVVGLDETELAPASTIDALYVADICRCTPIMWPALERLIRRYRVGKITWWTSREEGGIPEDLLSVCPQVTIVSHKESNTILGYLDPNY